MINFLIKALPHSKFTDLFSMNDSDLQKLGAKRMIADANPGFPCRVSLQDAAIGEEVILLSYEHHHTNGPYHSSGPIFVRKNAKTILLKTNEIPEMLYHRLLSLRGYDAGGMMKHATVVDGKNLREQINSFFENTEIIYIHVHNAKPGCYNCTVERI